MPDARPPTLRASLSTSRRLPRTVERSRALGFQLHVTATPGATGEHLLLSGDCPVNDKAQHPHPSFPRGEVFRQWDAPSAFTVWKGEW